MAAATNTKNVREIRELKFKDGSSYAGQALEGYTGTLPHGYGCLTTKEGFAVEGSFVDGKSQGEAKFLAPNGDAFWGTWNKQHKRHGKGLSIRAADGVTCVEEYDDGKLLKKVKRRAPAASTMYWLGPLSLPGVSSEAHHKFSGEVPPGHSGHTATLSKDGALVVVFGGERSAGSAGATMLSNDVYMLDVASGVWVRPATSGTVPPPMSGHTATLVGGNRLVVVGGMVGGMESSSAVYVLDIATGVWTMPLSKSLSFMNHSATLIGNKEIWVILQASVFVLTIGSGSAPWEWREVNTDNRSLPRQIPRSFINHSAVAVGEQIYVFGGKWLGINHGEGKKYERLSSDLRILNTSTLMWNAPACTAPPAPAVVAGAAAAVSDYSGFIRGSWSVPRCEHTATLVGNLMYVVGGWTTSNPAMNVVDTCYLNDVAILNVDTFQWSLTPALPLFLSPRSLHSMLHLSAGPTNELWCYGGRNSAFTTIPGWDILHLPQEGAAAEKKPAAAKKPAASSASSSSSSSSVHPAAAQLDSAAAAAVDEDAGEIAGESAGSGSIMDAFMSQQKK